MQKRFRQEASEEIMENKTLITEKCACGKCVTHDGSLVAKKAAISALTQAYDCDMKK